MHGYPYPDLHCGNVIVVDGVCKLTDYEKVLLGQPARYREFTEDQTQTRDFGCLLFEMACGFEPTKRDIKFPPASMPSQVGEVIQKIYFDGSSLTLDDLIGHPFFDVVPKGLTPESGDSVRCF